MDNAKSYLPRFLEKTKENQGAERLQSKISGCIMYSGYYVTKRKCFFYINHDQVLHSFFFVFFPYKVIFCSHVRLKYTLKIVD